MPSPIFRSGSRKKMRKKISTQKTGIKRERNQSENRQSTAKNMLSNKGGITQDQQPLAILMSSHLMIVYECRIPLLF